MTRFDLFSHIEFSNVVLPSNEFQGVVFDDEIGGEHRRSDFTIISAVADEL